ncbi:gamma-glutamyl-gamma-aminobutyrate hydrolase family protein [Thioalkalivibrio sp. XN8]|uniref:gamma-glutamyl-gamma-aminobutyrate hydrolase family protein n=1 Tax=Thioalkalivibrio sp. XN8 TaxID=2712863 RepID=UPI0013EB2F40|nr:gamma-glutamyl-gamma-aminobutyrate hydrolase family protein [Thioalkalivibrio sp. XN8]
MAQPLIAVTGPTRRALGPRLLVSLALRRYGARVAQLRPGQEAALPDFDGAVITGGHDVDPVLYAAEPEVEPRHDAARDAFESAVIDRALAARIPLLGICRGAQLLNVRRGGSLFQELASRRSKTSNRWTVLPLKTLHIDPHTRLQDWLGPGPRQVNSLHNQAIDRVGTGLRVSGRDLDGIVQAVEDPERPFLLGVQWHPEFLLYLGAQRHLFRALVHEAARYRRERPGAAGAEP